MQLFPQYLIKIIASNYYHVKILLMVGFVKVHDHVYLLSF